MKGKFEENTNLAGEGKVLPCLIQNKFEGDEVILPLDSYSKVKITLKSSDDQGFMGNRSNQGWRKG